MSLDPIESLTQIQRDDLDRTLRTAFVLAVQRLPVLQSPAVVKTLALIADPAAGGKFAFGYAEGFVAGFIDGAELWRKEFDAMLRLVGVGTVVGVAEFFARPILEDNPEGLLPQSKEALSTLNTLRTLKPVLLWLDAVGVEKAAATMKELLPSADEVLEIIEVAGREWLLELCKLAPDARAMGKQCGRLLGRLVLEMIRADVEPFSFGVAGTLEYGGASPSESGQ